MRYVYCVHIRKVRNGNKSNMSRSKKKMEKREAEKSEIKVVVAFNKPPNLMLSFRSNDAKIIIIIITSKK